MARRSLAARVATSLGKPCAWSMLYTARHLAKRAPCW
jgi:hypothetical protein